jgi:hypothetical protein
MALGGTLQECGSTLAAGYCYLTFGIAFTASAVFDFVEALYHRP